jgi:hypothetical protein
MLVDFKDRFCETYFWNPELKQALKINEKNLSTKKKKKGKKARL